MKITILIVLIFILSSFDASLPFVKLVFEDEADSGKSFCMYDDGKFYESNSSGCTGQIFAWGYWKNVSDTFYLNYQSQDIFSFEVEKSLDSMSRFQVIRVLDCYDQPVRFQYLFCDTTTLHNYNLPSLKVEKGKYLLYATSFTQYDLRGSLYNADTITYRWHCNRESVESINARDLYVDSDQWTKRFVLKNKRINWLAND